MSERDQFTRQVEKLVQSHVLHGSESLCKLLRYLASHSLNQPGIPLKEYQIATEVFGRPADFDPQSDSTIRVQAGRLRSKLAEYYATEGADDPVVVEMPKGSYVISFHYRSGESALAAKNGAEAIPATASLFLPRSWKLLFAVMSILLAASVAAIVTLLETHKPNETALANAADPAPAAFRIFWSPFLTSSDEPWVIFSNAAFIGRPETGMRYYDPRHDPQNRIWDHYTGVGEVLAVHNLDQVFSALHRPIRVKRGSLFSLDDAKNNDLIFVGSPSENLTLDEIPGTEEFVFRRLTSGARKGDLSIVNLHPQAGEPETCVASPSNVPLTEDYAVVGLMPGLTAGHSVMILAGTTTFGTQGAVEFVARETDVGTLLNGLSVSAPADLKPFEALLHIKIARGVPVETELVAVRKRPH